MANRIFSHVFVFLAGRRTVVAAALVCLVVAAVSCRSVKTVTVEVPIQVHDTTYVSQQVHDSVFVESKEYVKGDTVYKYKTKYVEKTKTDTIVKYVEKPVEIVKEVKTTEYVERRLRWWQRAFMGIGASVVLFTLMAIIYLAIKTKK